MEKKMAYANVISEPLVSVIIPVYNTEKYLSYCMKSILSQTYKNLEIILVNDGSTDDSGRLCDYYAERDCRVKVLHKQNGGQSSARNAGLQIMTGEYVAFVDSDDYVRVDYVQILVEYMRRDKGDMVIAYCKKVIGNQVYDKVTKPSNHRVLGRYALQYGMLSREIPMYVVGKLYQSILFKNVMFPVGKLFEDFTISWEIGKLVDRVTIINAQIYFYRQVANSSTSSKFHDRRMQQVYSAEAVLEEVKENEMLGRVAASRCFYAVADNYALVDKNFQEEKRYLERGLLKYRGAVLMDTSATGSLKAMAVAAYISPAVVRIIGKCYKNYNKLCWQIRGLGKAGVKKA